MAFAQAIVYRVPESNLVIDPGEPLMRNQNTWWVLIGIALSGQVASAGQIAPGDFGPNAVVQNFNGLGLFVENNSTPLVIGNDTYNVFSTLLTYNPIFGPAIGRTGEAIGTSVDTEYIDIVLGTPVHRVGGYIGTTQDWTAFVEFFDQADASLGSITIANGLASVGQFVGWEADAGLIQRIRINDTLLNGRIIILDDLTTEIVPEPSSLVLLLLGLVGLAGFCRRNALFLAAR
jgi:hypothetical protein